MHIMIDASAISCK